MQRIVDESKDSDRLTRLVDVAGIDSAVGFINELQQAFPDTSPKGALRSALSRVTRPMERIKKAELKGPGGVGGSVEMQAPGETPWTPAAHALQQRLSTMPAFILIDEFTVFLEKMLAHDQAETERLLGWLVEFMRLWFSADDLQRLARGRLMVLRDDRRHGQTLDYELALSDALPDTCDERHLLEWSLFSTARRQAERSHQALSEILPELFDGSEPLQPLVTADDYLQRFQALDAKLMRCPHVPEGEGQAWVEAVKGSLGFNLANKERAADAAAGFSASQYQHATKGLAKEAKYWQENFANDAWLTLRTATLTGDFFPDCPDAKLAFQQIITEFSESPKAMRFAIALMAHHHQDAWTEKLYRKLCELHPEDAGSWVDLGNLLQDHLKQHPKAEAAYRQAVELDPEDPYPITNLARLLTTTGGRGDADVAYRRAADLAIKQAEKDDGIDYQKLVLQSQLWLGNRDAAAQALTRLADAAADGNKLALFRLQEQARECQSIGRGLALAELMEASDQADLLQPIALALRVANLGPQALDGVAAEVRDMAETVLADILR